ncbi:hypothetical protein [Streptomyces sp. NRRL WC-3774]|nr:hypothetical protein [Streptomyces sp. NRRL WC-3774]
MAEEIPQPRRATEHFNRATRDACTIPHFNEFMCELFIERLLRDNLHAVVPSVGIDFVPVLQNCLDARCRRQARDLRLFLVTLCGSAVSLALFGAVGSLPGLAFLVVVALTAYCIVHKDLVDRRTAVQRLGGNRPTRLASEWASRWVASRVAVIQQTQGGNLSVYKDYSPFQGFGSSLSAWSLTTPLRPEQNDSAKPTTEFTAEELTEHVKGDLEGLHHSGHRAEDTRIEDRVFVNGKNLPATWLHRDEAGLKRSRRPVARIGETELQGIMDSPGGTVRHYLCAHTSSWEGEVVTSTFLHVSVESKTLYIDCRQTILGPVRLHPMAREILNGTFPRTTEIIGEAALLTLPWLLLAPFRAFNRWHTDHRLEKKRERELREADRDPAYDYSSWFSLRELVDTGTFSNFFQNLDADRQSKTAQRNILVSIVDFLDSHGVDTSEFRKQQTSILNHGVLQLGGVSNVNNQAVGPGSKALSVDLPTE